MTRTTGTYRTTVVGDEKVRAFVPHPLPPKRPVLRIEGELAQRHAEAVAAIGRLEVAGAMVPSPGWFLYGFVRKEAVVSSQIEGTQASLEDVVVYEAAQRSERHADVEEVCNYVDALVGSQVGDCVGDTTVRTSPATPNGRTREGNGIGRRNETDYRKGDRRTDEGWDTYRDHWQEERSHLRLSRLPRCPG